MRRRRARPAREVFGDAARLDRSRAPRAAHDRLREESQHAELIHEFASERLGAAGQHELAERIAPVPRGVHARGAARDRAAAREGELLGVAATNALELGIDIGSLDCAICVTLPGSVTSLRQQWGRAGRRVTGSRCSSPDDALDQYFMHEPETLLGRRVEAAVPITPTRGSSTGTSRRRRASADQRRRPADPRRRGARARAARPRVAAAKSG